MSIQLEQEDMYIQQCKYLQGNFRSPFQTTQKLPHLGHTFIYDLLQFSITAFLFYI